MRDEDLAYIKSRLTDQYRRSYRALMKLSKKRLETPTEDIRLAEAEMRGVANVEACTRDCRSA